MVTIFLWLLIQMPHTESIGLAPMRRDCLWQFLQMNALTMSASNSCPTTGLRKLHDLNIRIGQTQWNLPTRGQNGGNSGVNFKGCPSRNYKQVMFIMWVDTGTCWLHPSLEVSTCLRMWWLFWGKCTLNVFRTEKISKEIHVRCNAVLSKGGHCEDWFRPNP